MNKIFVVTTAAPFGGVDVGQVRVFATQTLAAAYQARTPNSAIIALDNPCRDGENAYIIFRGDAFGGSLQAYSDIDTANELARFHSHFEDRFVTAYSFRVITR